MANREESTMEDPLEYNINDAEAAAYKDLDIDKLSTGQVDAWVSLITSRPDVVDWWGRRSIKIEHLPAKIRDRRAESDRTRSRITFYPSGRRLSIVMHELSHQYCDRSHGNDLPPHSEKFATTHLELAHIVLGGRFANNLAKQYVKHGVTVPKDWRGLLL